MKIDEGISYPEARKRIKNRSVSYAHAAAQVPVINATLPSTQPSSQNNTAREGSTNEQMKEILDEIKKKNLEIAKLELTVTKLSRYIKDHIAAGNLPKPTSNQSQPITRSNVTATVSNTSNSAKTLQPTSSVKSYKENKGKPKRQRTENTSTPLKPLDDANSPPRKQSTKSDLHYDGETVDNSPCGFVDLSLDDQISIQGTWLDNVDNEENLNE